MERLKLLVVAGVLAVAVSVVGAGPAVAAKGGNSDNAHRCQKGGWESAFTTTGGTFANQGDCVSYGAQGGTVLGPFAGLDACEGIGGTFVPSGAHPVPGVTILWFCRNYPVPPNPDVPEVLSQACSTDVAGAPRGELSAGPSGEGLFTALCVEFANAA